MRTSEATRAAHEELDAELDEFLRSAYHFVGAHPEEWRLDENVDLEVTNHVLRVYIQDGTIAAHAEHVLALARLQREDGGWGDHRDDRESQLRSSAFCAQMLLRANRELRDAELSSTIQRALSFILARQLEDGSWRDHRWHLLDATSVSVGTLLFAVNEPFATDAHRRALQAGMQFVLSQQQPDGLWHYKPTASPVTITAHLLQKCATHGCGDDFVARSGRALMALQDPAGHWDKENTDHTCDSSRCLMLAAATTADRAFIAEVEQTVQRALRWLLDSARDGALGDRPGHTPHVERTCDGIDTILKYRRFRTQCEGMLAFWR